VTADDPSGAGRGVDLEQGPEDEPASEDQQDGGGDLDHQHGSLSSEATLRQGTVRAGPEFRPIFASWQANFRFIFAMRDGGPPHFEQL
jgi:hypothetical protein